MWKMGNQLPLARQLAKFLLTYYTTPHSAKHQQQQKATHDNIKALAVFKTGVLAIIVQNHKSVYNLLYVYCQVCPVNYMYYKCTCIRLSQIIRCLLSAIVVRG